MVPNLEVIIGQDIIDIMIIVAIVLVFVLSIFALKEARKAVIISRVNVGLLVVLGLIFIFYLVRNLRAIEPKDWSQILLVLGLVAVTALYAFYAARQASASVEMAEEMREQRHDALRPVIDIQRQAPQDIRTVEVYAAGQEDTSHGLSCILHNIGLGPATDVYSFIQTPTGERWRWDFGTLAIGGKTVHPMSLSLEQEDNRIALVAYYRDVYGRPFESSRKVSIEKKPNPNWVIGPLKIRPVKEDELP